MNIQHIVRLFLYCTGIEPAVVTLIYLLGGDSHSEQLGRPTNVEILWKLNNFVNGDYWRYFKTKKKDKKQKSNVVMNINKNASSLSRPGSALRKSLPRIWKQILESWVQASCVADNRYNVLNIPHIVTKEW